MPLQLRDNLHWCNCQGRIVFLDTEADRYFCLPQSPNDAFLRLAAREVQPGDAERLHMMVDRGMLREGEPDACIRAPPQVEAPTHDFPQGKLTHPISVLRALALETRIARALRTRHFHQVIEAVRASEPRRRAVPGEPDRAIDRIVSASAAVAFLTGSHDRCLVRALAVQHACRRSGLRPKLVFGVIANPFAAHCWVQLGPAVLVGGYEQARLYTPILAVE